MRTQSDQSQPTYSDDEDVRGDATIAPPAAASSPAEAPPSSPQELPANVTSEHGWCVPSELSLDPDEARACISLPGFDASVLSRAQVIAEYFPFAESECRGLRGTSEDDDAPRFEKVFRFAATIANVRVAPEASDYDELLILTAWQCVRPQEAGFLGSYPKSLLCPLSHAATPSAVDLLPAAKRIIFQRRVPVYLRYLLHNKFGLRTCADIENADLRELLRSTGFRLIRPSAVPEIAFPGITRGEDPPVRPWKLTLRQELSDERAAEMLIHAALWQIKFGLRLVTMEEGLPRWNIGAFGRTDWEDAFLSLGVRVAPSLMRESGLLDWRAVLARCLDQIGIGNLPPEVLGKVSALPQRVHHDDQQAIWEVLDRASQTVLEQVRLSEPQLFTEELRAAFRSLR